MPVLDLTVQAVQAGQTRAANREPGKGDARDVHPLGALLAGSDGKVARHHRQRRVLDGVLVDPADSPAVAQRPEVGSIAPVDGAFLP